MTYYDSSVEVDISMGASPKRLGAKYQAMANVIRTQNHTIARHNRKGGLGYGVGMRACGYFPLWFSN